MKKLVILSLLAAAACREPADTVEKQNEFQKPTETNEEFGEIRSTYERHARERLNRIDLRLRELESRGETTGEEAVAELRARRDALANRLDEIGEQAKSSWDQFEAEMARRFDELERDVDGALQ